MMFQIFATAVLTCIVLYAYSQGRISPFLMRFTVLIAACGEYLVLFPEQTNVIAQFFGVGRGADLMLYLWVLITFVVVINVHLRIRSLNDRLIELTRQLALNEVARGNERAN